MKRNMMRRNLRRSITKSFGRYIAIAMIIALGAGMFVGLRSTKTDMVETGREYMRTQNMFDLRLLSTYGWDKSQLEPISQLPGIKEAEGVFYSDLIAQRQGGDDAAVYRFYTIPEKINRLVLLEGRMPQSPDECLADGFRNGKEVIGKTVSITDDNSDTALDQLTQRKFTVVGLVSTPLYMDTNRGNTTVGSGSITNYFFVPGEAFDVTYYTEIHATIDGEYTPYTQLYNDALSDAADTIKPLLTPYAQERLQSAKQQAEQALADGALGVSLGLGYAPECFYTTAELIRALSPIAGQDIPLTVHMRQEGAGVCDSIEEMLLVARELRVPLHISHLKAMGRDNWGVKISRALAMLEKARQEGLEVGCDVYPYTAGSTQLIHILPPDFLTGGIEAVVQRLQDKGARRELAERIRRGDGFDDIAKLAGWDGIRLTSLHCPEDHPYQGKSIAEIAALWGQNPLDCCCDLLVREHCEITMVDFMASEEDIVTILQSPLSNVISDSTYPTDGMLHPRVYGTFVHLLEHFVKERGVLTAEQAVHKMTQKPAQVLRLAGKGVLAPGMDADINVFALEKLHQPGTYENPCVLAQGMDYVLVDGAVAVEKGKYTGVKAGRILKRA